MTETLWHFINGERIAGGSGRQGDIFNPATGEVSNTVPFASANEVKQATMAAAGALPAWSATPPAKRAQVMFNFRSLILNHMDELAEIVSSEHGKMIDDAKPTGED